MTVPDPAVRGDFGAHVVVAAARKVVGLGVVDLYAGRFGEIATYLPGGTAKCRAR